MNWLYLRIRVLKTYAFFVWALIIYCGNVIANKNEAVYEIGKTSSLTISYMFHLGIKAVEKFSVAGNYWKKKRKVELYSTL